MTKARACNGEGQERSSRVASYALESARKWEGMNLHTPKGAPTLKVGVSINSRIFKK